MANQTSDNNKRIAKNTIMLYLRMFLTMVVGLYTSRVVLQTLGVEDYGIYGVVGGIVAMMGFLNASMSGATSRFLTFELGKGDKDRLEKTFSSALIVHIIIAAIVFIVAETVGLWFLCNKLVIPENRMNAAFCVYQMSIISAMLSITQVPYNACIIAHEKMDVYAYVEILNVTLKLLIVYLLVIGNYDKLILYAFLTLIVSVIILLIYRMYCIRTFEECHLKLVWERKFIRPLLVFSGWDMYGNMAGTAKFQGTVMLLNMFFGPIVNTGANIANTVIGTLSALTTNVIVAFRPQIIKQYAIGEIKLMSSLVSRAIVFSSLLLGYLAFPIVAEMSLILNLWLGQIPEYSVVLSQIAVFNSLVSNINMVVLIALHATGNIKKVSFYGGTLYLINICVVYFLLKYMRINAYWVFAVNCIFMGFVLTADIFLYKKQIPQVDICSLLLKKILPISSILVILYFIGVFNTTLFSPGWGRFCFQVVTLVIIESLLFYIIVFSKDDRVFCRRLMDKLKNKIYFSLKSLCRH